MAALYYLGLACLFTHELDGVAHTEWRLLFLLRRLPDASAAPLFIALHVPLFFAVLWLGDHRRERVRRTTRLVVAAFMGVHAILHLGLSSDPRYDFDGGLSQALILAAGACGAAYLLARRASARHAGPDRAARPAP